MIQFIPLSQLIWKTFTNAFNLTLQIPKLFKCGLFGYYEIQWHKKCVIKNEINQQKKPMKSFFISIYSTEMQS